MQGVHRILSGNFPVGCGGAGLLLFALQQVLQRCSHKLVICPTTDSRKSPNKGGRTFHGEAAILKPLTSLTIPRVKLGPCSYLYPDLQPDRLISDTLPTSGRYRTGAVVCPRGTGPNDPFLPHCPRIASRGAFCSDSISLRLQLVRILDHSALPLLASHCALFWSKLGLRQPFVG